MEPGNGEVSTPSVSDVRVVCAGCLGGNWGKVDHVWRCGDCNHRNSIVVNEDGLNKIKAQREAAKD